jgi:hypothetical protein
MGNSPQQHNQHVSNLSRLLRVRDIVLNRLLLVREFERAVIKTNVLILCATERSIMADTIVKETQVCVNGSGSIAKGSWYHVHNVLSQD